MLHMWLGATNGVCLRLLKCRNFAIVVRGHGAMRTARQDVVLRGRAEPPFSFLQPVCDKVGQAICTTPMAVTCQVLPMQRTASIRVRWCFTRMPRIGLIPVCATMVRWHVPSAVEGVRCCRIRFHILFLFFLFLFRTFGNTLEVKHPPRKSNVSGADAY